MGSPRPAPPSPVPITLSHLVQPPPVSLASVLQCPTYLSLLLGLEEGSERAMGTQLQEMTQRQQLQKLKALFVDSVLLYLLGCGLGER